MSQSPTSIEAMVTLDNCCDEPMIRNSVFELLNINLCETNQALTSAMQFSKALIACLFGNIDQYDRLQKVLNAAARVTCLIPKFAHITPVLRELHSLPVKFRVEFKIALLVFKTLNGLAPQYLSELLVVKRRTRYSLRSDYETLHVVPKVTRN